MVAMTITSPWSGFFIAGVALLAWSIGRWSR